jgi:carboxyl-terminal processing protease
VRMDLARVYARLGQTEKALSALEQTRMYADFPRAAEELGKDPAFAGLKAEPRFQAVLAGNRNPGSVYDGKPFETAYKDKLTVQERVAGLSLFWSEVRANFVHFAHVPELDWNRTYMAYLDKVMAAETTRDYYRVMMQLAPLLQDGHTNIYPPRELMGALFARPPVSTALVEGKVLVMRVDSATLARQLKVGDEIVAIDGLAVRDFASQNVVPFVSSSTAQDRDVRTYSYQLLSGASDTPVRLRLRSAKGGERDETVARSGYTDIHRAPAANPRMLSNGVAYIALDQFENDAGVKAFEQALPQIMQAKGMVIDVRDNGGGSSLYGFQILSYLSKQPIIGAAMFVRGGNAVARAQGGPVVNWTRLGDEPFVSPRETIYSGPVVVLTGPRTFSAGEDFTLAFDVMKRGKIIGRATGGSTGQPLHFGLPGGGSARVCVKRDTYPDGRAFVGTGIVPDIEVTPSVKDVRSGRDAALERALVELAAMKG